MTQEAFRDRVRKLAEEEAASVIEDLARLRFRAHEAIHVLRALKLPVPRELEFFEADAVDEPERAAEEVDVPVTRKPDVPAAEPAIPPPPTPAAEPATTAPDTRSGTERAREQRQQDVNLWVLEVAKGKPDFKWTCGELVREVNKDQGRRVSRDEVRAAMRHLIEADAVQQTINAQDAGAIRFNKITAPATGAKEKPKGEATAQQKKEPESPASASGGYRMHTGRGISRRADLIEENRQTVRRYVADHPGAKLGEIIKGVGVSQTVVSRYLKELGGRGSLRRGRGVSENPMGYYPAEEVQSPKAEREEQAQPTSTESAAPPRDAAPPRPDAPAPSNQVIADKLREAVVRRRGERFKAPDLSPDLNKALGVELPVSTISGLLDVLVDSGSLQGTGEGDARTYLYDRPTEIGSGIRRPKRGGPVAGTGRGQRAAHQEVQELIDAAKRAGAEVEMGAGGHWVVKYNGQRANISGTPSNPRTLLNDRARLRRLGLQLASA